MYKAKDNIAYLNYWEYSHEWLNVLAPHTLVYMAVFPRVL